MYCTNLVVDVSSFLYFMFLFVGEGFRLHQIETKGGSTGGPALTQTYQLYYGLTLTDLTLYKEENEAKVSRVCSKG